MWKRSVGNLKTNRKIEGCVKRKGNECVESGDFMRLCQAAADDELERSSLTPEIDRGLARTAYSPPSLSLARGVSLASKVG